MVHGNYGNNTRYFEQQMSIIYVYKFINLCV